MSLESIFGIASLIFGIYNIFLFFSTGVYTNMFLGIIFSLNGLYFLNTSKKSVEQRKFTTQNH
ncbi:MAG: hypothetical protein NKF70_04320 [Methanobacterium sp. ERen5]|nr:MAG: hypothetical protein NKF70_04320 [Methanobacterium sp. ERen5]